MPAQPVDATPSDMNGFSKGGVYDATNPGAAFVCAEGRSVAALESGAVVTRDRAGLR